MCNFTEFLRVIFKNYNNSKEILPNLKIGKYLKLQVKMFLLYTYYKFVIM